MIQIDVNLSNIDIEEFAASGDQQARQLFASIEQLKKGLVQFSERREAEYKKALLEKAQQAIAITATPSFKEGLDEKSWESLNTITGFALDLIAQEKEVE